MKVATILRLVTINVFTASIAICPAHAVVAGPGNSTSSDNATPRNGFGGTMTSLTEAENQDADKSKTDTKSSSDETTTTTSGSGDPASSANGSDSNDSSGKISELQSFNKAERVKTDCNKLLNAYAQSEVKAKRHAACQLFKSQHPECKVACIDYDDQTSSGVVDGGFKKGFKGTGTGGGSGNTTNNDPDSPIGAEAGALNIPPTNKSGSLTNGNQTGGTSGDAAADAKRRAAAYAQAVKAARNNDQSSDDDQSDGEDQDDSSTTKSTKSERTPSSSSGSDGSAPDSSDGSSSGSQNNSASRSNASNGSNTSKSSSGDDSSSTDATEAAELQKCQSLRDAAVAACTYQDSTDSASQSQGLSNTCDQMRSSGLKSGKSKNDAASVCIAKWNACSNVCASDADTYSDYDDSSVFASYARACQDLASKADELNKAASTSLDASDSGLNCMANSSDGSGAGGGPGASAEKKLAAEKKAGEACAADPTSNECAQAMQYASALKGVGQFGNVGDTRGPANVVDGSGLNVDPNSAFAIAASGGAGPTVGAIPNSPGGGAPGAGGAPAGAGGAGGLASALAAVASAAADVDKGFLGGVAGQIMNGENPWSNQDLKDMPVERIDRAINQLGGKPIGDLRQYLPKFDPRDIPADIRDQYYKPFVNIFERISLRYEYHCRLGGLLGCETGHL